jgi:hypothetical protein
MLPCVCVREMTEKMESEVSRLAFECPVQALGVSRLFDGGNLLPDNSVNAVILVIALLMESISKWCSQTRVTRLKW